VESMVGQEIIQEMIRAQIVAFLKSEDGRDWVDECFKKEFNDLFLPPSRYNHAFESKFMSTLNTKLIEVLGVKYISDLSTSIVTFGMKRRLEELGYEVKLTKEEQ